MSAQPADDPGPGEPYEVIHLGGEAAAIVPLPDLRRLRAVERSLSPSSRRVGQGEPSGAPLLATRPSWYVLGTHDHVIAPSLELRMATAAHSHIVRVRSGHLSTLTHPGLITEVIERAARSAG